MVELLSVLTAYVVLEGLAFYVLFYGLAGVVGSTVIEGFVDLALVVLLDSLRVSVHTGEDC